MVNMTSISIWTEADRLCERCAAQVAQSDDWLCQGCRSGIETHWSNLTNKNHYASVTMASAHQTAEMSQNVTRRF